MNGPESRTIVQLVLVDETGDSYYRMRWPSQDLAKMRRGWRVINLDARASERFLWAERADLLVIFQSSDIDLIPVIQARKARGLKTLVEYNDNFYAPARWSPVAKPWSSPLLWQTYELIMNAGDGLLVTGDGLFQLFSPQASVPIYILPNHFPRDLQPFERSWQPPKNEINLGWAGSLGHMADILSIMPLMNELMQEFPNLRLHLMGNSTLPELIGLPPNKVRYTPWGTMDDYFQFWKPIHIGIAPLLDTPYNRCRSDIKAVEMSGCATLPLLQNALPYKGFLQDTAMPSFSSLEELGRLLRDYLRNTAKLAADTERCYRYVETQRMGIRRKERLELYEQMMAGVEPPAFTWPVAPGYYELEGTAEKQTQSFTVLTEIQELWNKKHRTEALHLAEQAVKTNPQNPDWSLAELKCLGTVQPSIAASRIAELEKRFPRDLRFYLAGIGIDPQPEARLELWRGLPNKISAQGAEAAGFFWPEVLKLLRREARQPAFLLQVLELLSGLYSSYPDFRVLLADVYRHLGIYDKALEHYTWLSESYAVFEKGKNLYESVDPGFFPAWVEVLRARLQERKG